MYWSSKAHGTTSTSILQRMRRGRKDGGGSGGDDDVSKQPLGTLDLAKISHVSRSGDNLRVVQLNERGRQGRQRAKRRGDRGPTGTVNMMASEAQSSGKRVCVANNISKAYGENVIVDDFSTLIARRDRIGIVGPNGAGKTTLLNMLTGILEPDEGNIRLGKNLELETLDQRRDSLDPKETLSDALTGGGDKVTINGETRHVIGYMKDFLFKPEQARTPIEVLSGGERARLMLARALALPSNLLILDEPTNDLDLETLDLLQDMIADYAGTVILVSHDRDFIDRTATSTIMFEGEGRWQEYAGGYSDMLAQRGEGVRARKAEAARQTAVRPAAAKPAPAKGRAKLSFKDKYALDTLPGEIEALDLKIKALEEEMADPKLFSRDPARFDAASREHAKALQEKEAKEERWLELEMLREEVEG